VVRRFLSNYGELVLVFGVGLIGQLELWVDATWEDDRYYLAPIALGMSALLLLRVRLPLPTLLFELVALQLAVALSTAENNDPMGVILPVLVAVYSVGAHTRGRALALGSLVVLGGIVLAMIADGSSLNVSGFLFFGFFLGGPFLAGIAIRIRREREHGLARERDERARAAVAEERARVARELHDIVAHAISVVVLQARGGRRSIDSDPEETRKALDAIEATASQALGEMRRLLGMLKGDDEALGLAPQPSLAAIGSLVDQVRRAGLPTEVHVEGVARELPAGVDLSAYRIVQEALTNALKHAGPGASARVVVRYGEDELQLEVADDGTGPVGSNGAGHGLAGMRERVTVFGGSLESGPGAEGGFAVRAQLPL
jgi:signal transduction histidine kinase